MSVVFNLTIFFVTLTITLRFFHKDGNWSTITLRKVFRFFTMQSNAFCAVAALLMCLAPGTHWAWILKYIGTTAVTVTMLTVFLFLAPSAGKLGPLLKGADCFLHLITPLLAVVSFSVWEKRGMAFSTALLGLLPVALYGILYLYKVVFAPVEKRWDDFYGFNRAGKWPVAFALMLIGALAVCLGLMLLQNI